MRNALSDVRSRWRLVHHLKTRKGSIFDEFLLNRPSPRGEEAKGRGVTDLGRLCPMITYPYPPSRVPKMSASQENPKISTAYSQDRFDPTGLRESQKVNNWGQKCRLVYVSARSGDQFMLAFPSKHRESYASEVPHKPCRNDFLSTGGDPGRHGSDRK